MNDTENLTIWILDYFGIKEPNTHIVNDIIEALEHITSEEIRSLKLFVRNNNKHFNLKYLNAIQKLYEILDMYKKNKHERYFEQAQIKAEELSEKISLIAKGAYHENYYLCDKNFDFKMIKKAKGAYFNKKEIEILNHFGAKNIYRLIHRKNDLKESLFNYFTNLLNKLLDGDLSPNKILPMLDDRQAIENRKLPPKLDCIKHIIKRI